MISVIAVLTVASFYQKTATDKAYVSTRTLQGYAGPKFVFDPASAPVPELRKDMSVSIEADCEYIVFPARDGKPGDHVFAVQSLRKLKQVTITVKEA